MVYTLGESLLDVIFTNLDNVVAKPGGSMLNVAVSLGRMNIPVMHISEMGTNPVAEMMLGFLRDNGVGIQYINQYPGENTSLALAFLDQEKKPVYQFVNAYPETRNLVVPSEIKPNDLVVFGSLYAVSAPVRKTILSFIQNAKEAGATIVYDPNIRHKHHLQENDVKKAMLENLRLAHIIKASDEDCANLFGKGDEDFYLENLTKNNGQALIILTLGSNGAIAQFNSHKTRVKAESVKVVSTIGAGDAFNAGVIAALLKLKLTRGNIGHTTVDQLTFILEKGTHTAALVCGTMENYIPDTTNG
ncbi:MAG: carbohydrate kinase [Bacteroidales bacterium]|nr:carbohydrate kinase [Bacteroidales bacterium]